MNIASLALFMGQSNAMNFSTIGLPYSASGAAWAASPRIQVWNPHTNGQEQYNPTVNSDAPPSTCWGPEGEYARARLAAVPNQTVNIFKWAVGGCGLAVNPSGNDWSPYSSGKAFDQAITSLKAFCALLRSEGATPVIDTLNWIGNETDTHLSADANACQRNLQMFIRAIQQTMCLPNLRVCIARIAPCAQNAPYATAVRAAQQFVGALPGNSWVDTDDLAIGNVSPGHFDPPAALTLGARMFAAGFDQ